MNLKKIRNNYLKENYPFQEASAKVCQDIILSKIAKSPLSENVTIKGGVVIQSISKDMRRATRDFDMDFIRYPLEEEAIKRFIKTLNEINDGISINITDPIEELGHQEYHGKRVHIELSDTENNAIVTKLDIGVHKSLKALQEEYCFELTGIGEKVMLLVNTKEQIFTEKLKSLLKLGLFSTRYKDIKENFDLFICQKLRSVNQAFQNRTALNQFSK